MLESEKNSLIGSLRAITRGIEAWGEIWEFLRISELMMLDILEGRPENPAYAGRGDPEVGHVLFYLHYPHEDLLALARSDDLVQAAWELVAHAKKPWSTIEPDYFAELQQRSPAWPLVGGDGAIWGFDQYEGLDFRWVHAFINLAITLTHKRHAFGANPCLVQLAAGAGGNVRLGFVGDWGTGIYGQDGGSAAAVIKQLAGLGCDYLFHLGDTYYAGTGGAPYAPMYEEITNFLQLWPERVPGRSFTLNSNHEMYSGGNGYFPLALGNEIFKHQNMTSYFALTFGKWVILGLDTAYNAHLGSLYLKGVLGDQQGKWIRNYGAQIGGYADKKVMVLTHHEAHDLLGANLTPLHQEIGDALGRAPDVWYWGHAHNGIAYTNASAAGKAGTRARCVGHSAIPYGLATDLMDAAGQPIAAVDYFTRTPMAPGALRVLNGFATVELSANGGITELFYEQGNMSPVWKAVNGTRVV